MIPRSVSASSLDVAQKCMARWRASSFDYGATVPNGPGKLGTALHAAIEKYTYPSMMAQGVWDWDFIKAIFDIEYEALFGSDRDFYEDGVNVLAHWFDRDGTRSSIHDAVIVSREIKEHFLVPYVFEGKKESVKFNYIIDRLDQVGENEYRVVDYKSQRIPFTHDQMRRKIQPRTYALAIQIKYPNAEKIMVEYDFLRHERVGIELTRDDQAVTWRWLKRAVQRIVDTPYDKARETLNDDCRYCVKMLTCDTFNSNVQVGGINSLTIDELARLHLSLKARIDGIKIAEQDVELMLMRYAQQENMTEWENETTRCTVEAKTRRAVNHKKMLEIIGQDLMNEYGGKIGVADIDRLRKDPRLDPAKKSLLNSAVTRNQSAPSIKVEMLSELG